jgi:hypothetical protein
LFDFSIGRRQFILAVSPVTPLAVRRFGPQNTKKITGRAVGTGTHNERTRKKKTVSLALATKEISCLRKKTRH